MRRLLTSNELKLVDLVSLGDKLEALHSAFIEQTDQVNRLLLLEADLVAQLVQVELQFATIDRCSRACPVQSGESLHILLSIFIIRGAWYINYLH